MRKLIERIEAPRGEKRGYIRLKPAIVAQHGDCAEEHCGFLTDLRQANSCTALVCVCGYARRCTSMIVPSSAAVAAGRRGHSATPLVRRN